MTEPTVQQMIDFTVLRGKSEYDSNLQFGIDLNEVGVDVEDMPQPVNISADPKVYELWRWTFSWGEMFEDQSQPWKKRMKVVDHTALSKFF